MDWSLTEVGIFVVPEVGGVETALEVGLVVEVFIVRMRGVPAC